MTTPAHELDAIAESVHDAVETIVHSPWKRRPEEHPFLPMIVERSNNIMLINTRDSELVLNALLFNWSARAVEGVRAVEVVPVEGLRMNPQPPSACNYMGILAALRPLYEYLLDSRVFGNPLGTAVQWHAESKFSIQWQLLVSSISAWSGNVKTRGPYLDPESYSHEMLSEHTAVSVLDRRWNAFMDILVEGLNKKLGTLPVIVVPVRNIEGARDANALMQALHKLSHPRLIYLCTGHSSKGSQMIWPDFIFPPNQEA